MTVKGIKQADDSQIWVQQDLAVNGPNGGAVLNKENMVDLHSKAPAGTNQVTFNNDLNLPVGAYEATISVHDKISGGITKTTLKFTVEG